MRIQISRRLVGKDNARPLDDRSCNGHSLLLTARKLGGVSFLVACKPHSLQCRLDQALVLDAAQVEGEDDVLVDRQLVDEVVVLKDKADVRVAVIAEIPLLKAGEIVAVHLDPSAREIVQTADEIEQGGFSASALSQNEDEPRVGQGQVHVLERVAVLSLFRFVDLVQCSNVNHIVPQYQHCPLHCSTFRRQCQEKEARCSRVPEIFR